MRICWLLVLLLPLGIAFGFVAPVEAGSAAQSTRNSPVRYRLTREVSPVRYDINLRPDLATGKFTGEERIWLNVRKPTSEIALNVNGLVVSKVVLRSGETIKSGTVIADPKSQQVRLRFANIPIGSHELSLRFSGQMSDQLNGLYRSRYKNKQGTYSYFACTQFEPTDARMMIPCFDEPDMKAIFKLGVSVDPALTALSNMPVEKEFVENGRKEIQFEESPVMSSYLLALVIGDYKATEPVVSEGVPIRVWCVGRDPKLGRYSRDMAAKVMTYLSGYFKVPYGWKKLDLIAVPDFEAGAMENPGAITFRETLLLIDQDSASLDSRQDSASVIAHEMAHLWFGDLVTMKWWDDIWLNEAFATWMAVKAIAAVVPQWHYQTWYGSERLHGMGTDSMHSTRAIHASVRDPLEAKQMFDEITYQKGATVLRMLEMYLGEETFQKGVEDYMQTFKYANAAGADLWKALQKASGKPVVSMMEAWSNTPGYPLITLAKENGKLSLSQERFLLDGSIAKPAQLWKVPVGLRAVQEPVDSFAQPKPDSVVLCENRKTIADWPKAEIFTANCGGYGFYRLKYPQDLLRKLVESMPSKLSAVERQTLLSDQMVLTVAGRAPFSDYIDVLSAFKNENYFLAWQTVTTHIYNLELFVNPSQRAKYAGFVRALLSPEAQRLGWAGKENESEETSLARQAVLTTLGTIGQDKGTIESARRLFRDYLQSPASVAPDLVDTVTSIVAYNGGAAEYESIKKLWKSAGTPEIEHRNLFALAQFQKPDLLKRTLNMTLTDEVPDQDAPGLVAGVLRNNAGANLGWQFVRTNWPRIQKRFSPDLIVRVASACDRFTTAARQAEVRQFFAAHPLPQGKAFVKRMLERLSTNVRFARAASPAIKKWLEKSAG